MKVKDMIQENNRLREQMTPFNRSYMEDMIISMRASRVNRVQAEELLLDAARKLLEAQKKGKNAKQLFGNDPEDYFREVMENVPARPARSKLNYYGMITCAALTCLFGIFALFGLISQWGTGSPGMFGQISLFTILAVGLGSIVVMEIVMKWLSSLSESDAPMAGKFDFRALGIYIGIAVVIVYAGLYLSRLFPVIAVSPWVSLCLCLVGLIGLKFVFMRK